MTRRGAGVRSGAAPAAGGNPAADPGEEEMPMHRYVHTIPAASVYGGTWQQLEDLSGQLTTQTQLIQEMRADLRELLEILNKKYDPGP